MEHSSPQLPALNLTEDERMVLNASITGLLFSKIKLVVRNALKNTKLSQNDHIVAVLELLGEHIIPQYCAQNAARSEKIALMHSLVYLLASKAQSVFTSGVVRTCIDQNWDLKGFKSVLLRILREVGLTQEADTAKLKDYFDKLIQSQNLQSQSCIKAVSHFLKNTKKNIEEDDLKNPVISFQTSFDFVRGDIERYRSQNMKYECFQVLHPWAYDLDQVDFKYVINKDETQAICRALKNPEARVFWLSYFKSQLAVSADEFIAALREYCILNQIPEFFTANYGLNYRTFMLQTDFCVSLSLHGQLISQLVFEAHSEAIRRYNGYSLLKGHQVRFPGGGARGKVKGSNEYINEEKLSKAYKIGENPYFDMMTIGEQRSWILPESISNTPLVLRRSTFQLAPNAKQGSKLTLKFSSVDTDELKDLEIKFDGNLAQFKVGEGDCNHYVIANDKKLWESQFVIINRDGKYYLRDLGIVHTSRLKVTGRTALQLHQGALIDLGKVVHYHVNKLTHEVQPSAHSKEDFIIMRGSHPDYRIDDEAIFRARPAWISADENRDMVQNEIMLESSSKQAKFSIGRSNRRDVELKLKAVSADHCKIEYSRDKGWLIHEQGKDRLSSNGTFVFMKSHQQMEDHEPSDLIPLFNGMIISFINYELQVMIEPKTSEELDHCVSAVYEGLSASQQPSARAEPEQAAQASIRSGAAPSQKESVKQSQSVVQEAIPSHKSSLVQQPQFGQTAVPAKHEHEHVSEEPPVQIVDDDYKDDFPESHKVSQTEKVKLSELKAHDDRSPHHSEGAASFHEEEEAKAVMEEQIVQTSARKPESHRHEEAGTAHKESVHESIHHHDEEKQIEEDVPVSAKQSVHQSAQPSVHEQSVHHEALPSAKASIHEDAAHQSHNASIHEDVLPSAKGSVHEEIPASHKASVHEEVPISAKASVHEEVPASAKASVHEEVPDSHKESVHEEVPASAKASVHEEVPASAKASVHEPPAHSTPHKESVHEEALHSAKASAHKESVHEPAHEVHEEVKVEEVPEKHESVPHSERKPEEAENAHETPKKHESHPPSARPAQEEEAKEEVHPAVASHRSEAKHEHEAPHVETPKKEATPAASHRSEQHPAGEAVHHEHEEHKSPSKAPSAQHSARPEAPAHHEEEAAPVTIENVPSAKHTQRSEKQEHHEEAHQASVHEEHKASVHEPEHKASVHEPEHVEASEHKASVHEPEHKESVHEHSENKASVHEPEHKESVHEHSEHKASVHEPVSLKASVHEAAPVEHHEDERAPVVEEHPIESPKKAEISHREEEAHQVAASTPKKEETPKKSHRDPEHHEEEVKHEEPVKSERHPEPEHHSPAKSPAKSERHEEVPPHKEATPAHSERKPEAEENKKEESPAKSKPITAREGELHHAEEIVSHKPADTSVHHEEKHSEKASIESPKKSEREPAHHEEEKKVETPHKEALTPEKAHDTPKKEEHAAHSEKKNEDHHEVPPHSAKSEHKPDAHEEHKPETPHKVEDKKDEDEHKE